MNGAFHALSIGRFEADEPRFECAVVVVDGLDRAIAGQSESFSCMHQVRLWAEAHKAETDERMYALEQQWACRGAFHDWQRLSYSEYREARESLEWFCFYRGVRFDPLAD